MHGTHSKPATIAARRRLRAAGAAALLSLGLGVAPLLAAGTAQAESAMGTAGAEADARWPDLVKNVFDGRKMVQDSGVISLEAPYRAADAAIVPMTITLDPAKDIRKVTLVIDENPSPVAATFEIGEDSGLTELSTRVRVNAYTDVHAVAEAADGTLYVTKEFVKASGGCAAPATKDPELAARTMGEMKLRRFGAVEGSSGEKREAQVMIRHPNNSGLQMNQVTMLYIPAHFVTDIEVTRNGETLFSMTGGISISEDPTFRFNYDGDHPGTFQVTARDTEGNVFQEEFSPEGAS